MEKGILSKYLPIIQTHYPDSEINNIKLIDEGHDHYVFVLDNLHAFRFPRTDTNGKKDSIENEFLKHFSPISPLPVQQTTGYVDSITGTSYQTYNFIPGIPFSKDLAVKLKKEELLAIACDLGKFLACLHSFPLKEAKKLHMDSITSPEDYGLYFKNIVEADKKLLYSIVTPKEWQWIEKLLYNFYDLTQKHPFSLTVTHSDLLSEHIVISEHTHKVSGIIDFSLRVADAANDFKIFNQYGDVFLKTVYKNYLPVDAYFEERRKFYASDLVVVNLYQSIERNDKKEKQEYYLKELKKHIANNPL